MGFQQHHPERRQGVLRQVRRRALHRRQCVQVDRFRGPLHRSRSRCRRHLRPAPCAAAVDGSGRHGLRRAPLHPGGRRRRADADGLPRRHRRSRGPQPVHPGGLAQDRKLLQRPAARRHLQRRPERDPACGLRRPAELQSLRPERKLRLQREDLGRLHDGQVRGRQLARQHRGQGRSHPRPFGGQHRRRGLDDSWRHSQPVRLLCPDGVDQDLYGHPAQRELRVRSQARPGVPRGRRTGGGAARLRPDGRLHRPDRLPAHRQRRQPQPRPLSGDAVRRVAGVVLRQAVPAGGGPLLQGRLDLHRLQGGDRAPHPGGQRHAAGRGS